MVTLPTDGSVWMDGKLVPWTDANVHILTQSLHYGWAVYEGIRAHSLEARAGVFRLADHLRRLRDSARVYMMDVPYTDHELTDAILEVVRANNSGPCYIRPVVYLGHGSMGVALDLSLVRVAIASWPWDTRPQDATAAGGLRVMISGWQRNPDNCIPPLAKATGGYINSSMAKIGAIQAGYDDALLLNESGRLAECSAANIFIVRSGVLYTPPVSEGILPGITRDTVITLATEAGLRVVERPITRAEAYTADELFITGTALGIAPVASVDDRATLTGPSGPVTRAILETYRDAVSGRHKERSSWITTI